MEIILKQSNFVRTSEEPHNPKYKMRIFLVSLFLGLLAAAHSFNFNLGNVLKIRSPTQQPPTLEACKASDDISSFTACMNGVEAPLDDDISPARKCGFCMGE
ncbi:hypothetical protein TrCOL_g12472 [Triparma columacea]|uniref:Uncharacterized protein n=1 Tax=Triparma columacea TaxID=722753 RepID=A0A9W7L2N1_9STRA|nr:hypothetical protein TrCOL_g12472 [Triparma columacea]